MENLYLLIFYDEFCDMVSPGMPRMIALVSPECTGSKNRLANMAGERSRKGLLDVCLSGKEVRGYVRVAINKKSFCSVE